MGYGYPHGITLFSPGINAFFPRISHSMAHLPSSLVPCPRAVTAVRPNMTSRFRRILAVACGQSPRPGTVEDGAFNAIPQSSVGRRGIHCYPTVVVLSPWQLLTDSEQDFTRAAQEPYLGSRPLLPRIKHKATSQPSQPSQPASQPSQPSQSARATRASSQGSSQVRAFGSCHARPK